MQATKYECTGCGAELQFDPDHKTWTCPYCGNVYTQSDMDKAYGKSKGKRTVDQDVAASYQSDVKTIECTCPTCGAVNTISERTYATNCSFCNASILLEDHINAVCPDGIMPFAVTKEAAVQTLQGWCRKRWFLPKGFREPENLQNTTGYYVPYWIISCEAHTELEGTGQWSNTWESGNYRYTETKYYRFRRAADIPIQHIPCNASDHFNTTLLEAIEPFPYSNLEVFSKHYLNGYQASSYDRPVLTAYSDMKDRISDSCLAVLKKDANYGNARYTYQSIGLQRDHYNYVLLPVWSLDYKYRNNSYRFFINGQTGELAGHAPVSIGKCLLLSVILAVVVSICVFLFLYLLYGNDILVSFHIYALIILFLFALPVGCISFACASWSGKAHTSHSTADYIASQNLRILREDTLMNTKKTRTKINN